MQKNLLKNIGLTNVQAEIYEFLLENGENKASAITKGTKRQRGVIYKELDSLITLHLIVKNENKGITRFKLDHPDNLNKLLDKKEKDTINEISRKKNKLEVEKKSLDNAFPDILSAFNLNSGKPGITYFEGKEGILKILDDELTSKTEILTYADIYGMQKFFSKGGDDHIKKRKKLGIKKRGIATDTSFAREYLKDFDTTVTDIRFIDGEKYPMFLEMEIYDNRISFMTFSENKLIGVIIENEEIYKTQKSIFEMVWANAIPGNSATK